MHLQLYMACQPECPVGAIYDEEEVPAQYQGDIAANELFFRKLEQGKAARKCG